MQLNLKHEIIHNENKANVYCDTAYQCIIHAFGSIDLWRRKAKENGVHLWRIADALGITDGNFSRKLRKELSEAEKKQIFKIIDDLKERDKND